MKKQTLFENLKIDCESEFNFTCEYEKLNESDVNKYQVLDFITTDLRLGENILQLQQL